MAMLIGCPNCGQRDAYEFRFGGEVTTRPAPGSSEEDWAEYFYTRRNLAGVQREWWHHRFGCRKWFISQRDTTTNEVQATFWPEGAQR